MTYLNLINAVLRRLREDQVTTVDESDYSKLIGDFVNDALQSVESAWDWTVLRNTYSITTVAGTSTYTLTGFGTGSKILYVHDETNNRYVHQESLQRIREFALGTDNAQGTVSYYAIEGVDSNGDAQIRFYQTPSAVQNLSVYAVKRDASLSLDSDSTLLPTKPVIQFAFAYALRERGETGGQSAAEQLIFAQEDLRNAIALDANLHPEELIWNVV
jgi:hypothetical protein